MKISEIMKPVKSIDSNVTLKQAANLMSEECIGSLVVLKAKEVVGIITERDILSNITRLGDKVEKVMSKKITTIEEDQHIGRAIELMKERKIKRLPVTKEGDIIGIVTVTDIIANAENINEDFLID